ncbi:MAG: RNA polymerase sporulation sigma factor SigE [Ruminococcaceae bacterium]|nr:RNA polymerase sporulation sigma factor SigE [Oscillospiraceae bacterium]
MLEKIMKLIYSLTGKEEGIFYINGAETLPVPLDPEEECEILERLEKESSLRSVLVERNLRLVVYIAKKFENTGTNIEDLISIGTIGLIKAINTFRADKNIKLATYASRCIENEILMYIRKSSSQRCEMSFDEPLNIDKDGNELLLSDIIGSDEDSVFLGIEKSEDRKIVRQALSRLDPRERRIVELRYGIADGREYTQKQVAKMMGISQSYISRLEKKIIDRLHDEIKDRI